jgi:hypothetical protein
LSDAVQQWGLVQYGDGLPLQKQDAAQGKEGVHYGGGQYTNTNTNTNTNYKYILQIQITNTGGYPGVHG